ncbi:MAG: hypothetical protein ACUVTU_12410, partial [Desulfurispora sp.]
MEKLLRELLDYAEKSRTPVSQISALLGMLNLTALVGILAAREGVPMPAVGAALAGQARNTSPALAAENNPVGPGAGMHAAGINRAANTGSAGAASSRAAEAPGSVQPPPLPELATMLQLLLGHPGGPGGEPPGPGSPGAAGGRPAKTAEPASQP